MKRKLDYNVIVTSFKKGLTLTEIAHQNNCCIEAIRKVLKKENVFDSIIIRSRYLNCLSEKRSKYNPSRDDPSVSTKISLIKKEYYFNQTNRIKQSLALRGRVLSQTQKDRISKFYQTHPELWCGRLPVDEWLKRMFLGRTKYPTSLEKIIIDIINRYNLPYRYVGNGTLWIGNPPMNPDFIHLNEDIIVEVLGSYWHTPEEFKRRVDKFSNYGFKVTGIWENELDTLPEIEIVRRLSI